MRIHSKFVKVAPSSKNFTTFLYKHQFLRGKKGIYKLENLYSSIFSIFPLRCSYYKLKDMVV